MSETIEFTVGDVVRKLRINRNLTSRQLAEKAGIAQSTLSAIESGDDYRTSNLKAVAVALGFTVTELWHMVPAVVDTVSVSPPVAAMQKRG